GNIYQLKLKVYRDCYNGNSPFDNPTTITIFNSAGTLVQTVPITFPGSTVLPNNTGNICLTTPPNICVEQAIFTANVTLPPITGGYILVYQRCCRNASSVNISNSGTTGASFVATIPDPALATNNSSPVFTNFPPTCICVNQPLVFNHSATDIDGDQLVYSLFNPFAGASTGNPTPVPANPPPFPLVTYSGGYSYTYPVASSPALAINSSTGILTGTPNAIGQYVVGVCVKEYRNGVLIGIHYRDFQFNVVQCLQNVTASIPASMSACKNSAFTFTNNSVNGTYYHWDFGVTGTNADTSNVFSPTYTYATPGTYTVTLTVNPGFSCAVTTTATITVYPYPTATPSNNSPVCVGSAIDLFSATVPGATYAWTGPNGFTSSLQNPIIPNSTTTNAGTYHLAVTTNGCTNQNASNTIVVVNPIPAAPSITSNSPICVGATLNLTAVTVAGSTYNWTGPNGWTSNLQNPFINVTVATNAGTYTCTSTVNGCTSLAATLTVVLFPSPTAPQPGNNAPFCTGNTLDLTAATVAGATYSWTGPAGFTSSLQNPSIPNTTAANAGNYSLTINVNGCNSLPLTTNVVIYPIPFATPTNNGPICLGSDIDLFGATLAGATYSWTGPNGFTSSLQNPVIINSTIANGGVYHLSVTANGCSSVNAANTVVVIHQIPTAPVLSNNTPICVGTTLNLIASTIANATYQWTGPNGFTSSLQNPTINSTVTANGGVYSCVVTVLGCPSIPATTTVVLNPIPTTPTPSSNSPFCPGVTLTLNAATVAGATYSWTGPNGFSSSLQNPTIANTTSVNAGVYSLSINVNGCNSIPLTTTVVIFPVPNSIATSNSPACNGQAVHLYASTVAGGAYSWIGPGGFTSSIQNPTINVVSPANAGTFTVTASANGCTGNPSSTVVIVNPIPPAPVISNNAPMCSGQTLNLVAQNVAGGTFHWTGPNGFISNVQNPVITNVPFANSGTYSSTVTVLGCPSLPATTNAVINLSPPATPTNNGPLCDGQTLNLTTQPVAGSTYSWTGPNGFSSNQQNPVINNVTVGSNAGSYTLTMSLAGCVGNTVSTNVVIHPIPAAPVLTSNSSICAGQTLMLNAANVLNGVFAWIGPNSFSSGIQSPQIVNATTAASGTYTATVSQFNCLSPSSSVTVLVKPVPAAPGATSNSPVCAGQTISLNAGNIAGGIYSWTGPLSYTSSNQNASVANSATTNSGNYSVTASVNGCTSPASTVSVTVYPIPSSAFTLAPSVCAGNNTAVTYAGSSLASAIYNWNFSGAAVNTGSGQGPYNVDWANAGNHSVTLAVTENGCTSPTTSHSIIVYPIPTSIFNLPAAICQSD
ncbi:MAG: PKD domain-containing protein, partial [Bacteroidota bacterium]